MKYEVIHYFTDLQDFNHAYRVGDTFPRTGMRVSEARLKELSSNNNKQHKPLIKSIEDEPLPLSNNDIEFEERAESKQYTKSEINRMKTEDLQELAFNNGFENAYKMTDGELKKVLIEHFEL